MDVDKAGSDVVAPVVGLVPTGDGDAVNDESAWVVDVAAEATGTADAVMLTDGAGDDPTAVPSEDEEGESSELHPVAPAIASALAAATTIIRARAMLHPATTAMSRAITRPGRSDALGQCHRSDARSARSAVGGWWHFGCGAPVAHCGTLNCSSDSR